MRYDEKATVSRFFECFLEAGRVPDPSSPTLYIQACLDRMAKGDEAARAELLDCACGRLRNLARKMLRNYPGVHRWEETDDVLQNAILRLHRSLQHVPVQTTRDFFAIAALNIRRELLDLARHYYGPLGLGNGIFPRQAIQTSLVPPSAASPSAGFFGRSRSLDRLTEFHEQVERLPVRRTRVFDLIWYQELSQADAAALLNVSERTSNADGNPPVCNSRCPQRADSGVS